MICRSCLLRYVKVIYYYLLFDEKIFTMICKNDKCNVNTNTNTNNTNTNTNIVNLPNITLIS